MKRSKKLDPFGDLLANLFALGLSHRNGQLIHFLLQIDIGQTFANRFSAHFRYKRFRAVGLTRFAILLFAKQLVLLERSRTGINDHVILVINDALEIASSHVEDQAKPRGHAFKKPDMRNRNCQLDMPHALPTHAGEGHFHTATIAHHTAMLDALVLSAGAFPVLDRTENAFAEQPALFRLEGAVIDCFRILDFAFGPSPNRFGRGDGDCHGFDLVHFVQAEHLACIFFGIHRASNFVRLKLFTGFSERSGPQSE